MIPDPDLTPSGLEPNHWERHDGESPRSYAAFATFRDLGKLRTLRKAAARFYEHPDPVHVTAAQLAQFKEWSRTNGWVDRADAWDMHLDRISRFEAEQDARVMRTEYATIVRGMRSLVARSVTKALADPTIVLDAKDTGRWLEIAQKIEAWAREVPSEITEQRHTGNVTFEERKAAAREALSKLRLVREADTG